MRLRVSWVIKITKPIYSLMNKKTLGQLNKISQKLVLRQSNMNNLKCIGFTNNNL